MGGKLSVRLAGAVGALSLALFSTSLISVPSSLTTGAAPSAAHTSQSVNRALKGDRLVVPKRTTGPDQSQSPTRSRPQAPIPLGCDRAFSPLSSPAHTGVFRRCLV